ncbi:MAG: hypothetical protein SGBAC_001952 [Bacillariaceae sp.]
MSDSASTTTPPQGSYTNDAVGQSVHSEGTDSESGISPLTYILVTWGLLLISITTLVVIVCKRNRHRRQDEQQEHGDKTILEEGRQPADSNKQALGQKTTNSCHFEYVTLVAINATFALALSIYANLTCEFLDADESSIFMSFRTPLYPSDGTLTTTVEVYSLGLWSLVATNGAPGYLEGDLNGEVKACFELSDLFYVDGYYKMARASAVIASLIGGLSLLAFWVLACDSARLRRFSRLMGWSFGVTTVFQLLTLAFLGTEYCNSSNCALHVGGTSSVTAAAYWLFCVFAVLSGL